ncbi:MAG: A/G-specific adenine glycosylase, partial [Pseudomonadota bacterium]
MTSNSTVQLNFGERLLAWWDVHGRRDLPWQQQRTPYRVWVSEIMLQQTRVETATAYYQRFMQRLPRLEHLANAELDDVLSLWSGLGYYARARNLHKTAIIVRDQYQGEFPDDLEQLEALPGIGRSTAAAIRAQAFGRRAAILDGNVKRVMARHAAIDGWPGQSRVAKQLWAESELRTPEQRPADYTQAIMDLGATLCSRSSPDCTQCPVQQDCKAHLQQRQHELPAPKPRKTVPLKTQVFDLLRNHNGHILMQRRPPSGIWGGLWCLPEHGQIELPR